MSDKNILRRKYCFTPCFKRKMSALWTGILTVLVFILFAVGFIVLFTGLSFTIGFIYEWLMGTDMGNYLDNGAMIIVFGSFTVAGIYWLSKAGAHITTGTVQFIKERYEGEPYQCSIFERCEGDKDD